MADMMSNMSLRALSLNLDGRLAGRSVLDSYKQLIRLRRLEWLYRM